MVTITGWGVHLRYRAVIGFIGVGMAHQEWRTGSPIVLRSNITASMFLFRSSSFPTDKPAKKSQNTGIPMNLLHFRGP